MTPKKARKCPYFQTGHCSQIRKGLCPFSHSNIVCFKLECDKSCGLRHPNPCKLFANNKCLYKQCSYSHSTPAHTHPIDRHTMLLACETETRVPNHEAVRKPIQLSECPATNSKPVAKLPAICPSILLAGVEIQHVIYAFLLLFLSSLMQTQCLKKDNEKLETEILGRIHALEQLPRLRAKKPKKVVKKKPKKPKHRTSRPSFADRSPTTNKVPSTPTAESRSPAPPSQVITTNRTSPTTQTVIGIHVSMYPETEPDKPHIPPPASAVPGQSGPVQWSSRTPSERIRNPNLHLADVKQTLLTHQIDSQPEIDKYTAYPMPENDPSDEEDFEEESRYSCFYLSSEQEDDFDNEDDDVWVTHPERVVPTAINIQPPWEKPALPTGNSSGVITTNRTPPTTQTVTGIHVSKLTNPETEPDKPRIPPPVSAVPGQSGPVQWSSSWIKIQPRPTSHLLSMYYFDFWMARIQTLPPAESVPAAIALRYLKTTAEDAMVKLHATGCMASVFDSITIDQHSKSYSETKWGGAPVEEFLRALRTSKIAADLLMQHIDYMHDGDGDPEEGKLPVWLRYSASPDDANHIPHPGCPVQVLDRDFAYIEVCLNILEARVIAETSEKPRKVSEIALIVSLICLTSSKPSMGRPDRSPTKDKAPSTPPQDLVKPTAEPTSGHHLLVPSKTSSPPN